MLEQSGKERFGRRVGSALFPVFSAVSNVGNTYFSTHLACELSRAAEFMVLSQCAFPRHCHQPGAAAVPTL